jgi:hypothetical protein
MKKLITLLFAVALMFGCSSDSSTSDSSTSDSNSSNSSILIRKTIFSTETEGIQGTNEFIFQGRKLLKAMTSNGSYSKFTYTGDLITKEEYFQDPLNNEPTNTIVFDYSDNKLVQRKMYQGNVLKNKVDYFYESDNTVRIFHATYTGTETNTTISKKYYLNGEVIKRESLNPNGSINSTILYYYDTKNSPSKNILGYNIAFESGITGGVLHNLVKTVSSPLQTNDNGIIDYLYEYNSNGYPIKKTTTLRPDLDGPEMGTLQFLY